MAAFATTAWCFRSSVTDLAIWIKHFPQPSWRWRTQESRGPPASVSASTTRPARSKEYKIPHTRQNAFFKVPLYCSLCQVPAPVRKVRVRGLCELSIFDKWSHFYDHDYRDDVQGCTTTSSERTVSLCTLGTGTQFSTTTPASPHGFGTIGRIRRASLSVFLRSRPFS